MLFLCRHNYPRANPEKESHAIEADPKGPGTSGGSSGLENSFSSEHLRLETEAVRCFFGIGIP